ncbi:MAG: hypothetical protein WC244_04170 [Patescibacteria group bacterium]|jgi:hypothetical protein
MKKLYLLLLQIILVIINIVLSTYLYQYNLPSLQKYIPDILSVGTIEKIIVTYIFVIISFIVLIVSSFLTYNDKFVYWIASRAKGADRFISFIRNIQDANLKKILIDGWRVRMLVGYLLLGLFLLSFNMIFSLLNKQIIPDAFKITMYFFSLFIWIAYSMGNIFVQNKIMVNFKNL